MEKEEILIELNKIIKDMEWYYLKGTNVFENHIHKLINLKNKIENE